MGAWIYWLPFLSFAALSFFRPKPGATAAVLVAVFLVAFVGLRHEVGTDWGNYLRWNKDFGNIGIGAALEKTDAGYALLSWLGANGFGGVYFVNLVCAAIAMTALVVFAFAQANPFLALTVAFPQLITLAAMNYTRQSAAVGLGMVAMLAIQRRRPLQFLAFVTAAALFHKTAVCLFILLPALWPPRFTRSHVGPALGILAYVLAFSVFTLRTEFASLLQDYVSVTGDAALDRVPILMDPEDREPSGPGNLYSAGALPRIAQSVVAAGCFAIIAWKTRLQPPALWLWSIVSAVVIALFAIAFWRSTLADRTALYFLPIQLYAFSILPTIFRPTLNRLIHTAIVACIAAAFAVWLLRGSDIYAWVPYGSVLMPWMHP